MSAIKVYILLSLSVLCITNGQGQGQRCLDGFPSVTDNTCTLSTCPIQGISSSRQLRLFPSMRITCNGMLVGLSVAGETLSGGDYPILQIWRPTGPTPNDYERISEYTFPIGCTQLHNNVWQCRVDSIDVEERDIIGIDLPLAIKTVAAFGMYSMSPPSFTSYTLSSTTERTFSVPVSAITDSAQPLLTLDIQEQVIETPTTELTTQTPTTELTTQTPTTQQTTQAQPTTQAPTIYTQRTTQGSTTQRTTQAPTTQLTTQAPTTQLEDHTTAEDIGQPTARGTEIVGPLVGGVVGVLLLVLIVALVVGLVVYILTRRRFTNKWKPEVVSEHQLAEGSQRGVISNGIHSAETVIELGSRRQSTDSMSSNPLYMPNTDASIKYEGEPEYTYIDQKDIRILARNPIVGVGEDADNVAYSLTTH